MQSKKILTAILLLFVGFSLVELVLKRVREASAGPDGGQQTASAPSPAPSPAPVKAEDGKTGPGATAGSKAVPAAAAEKVIAHYFHGRERCANCRNYETLSREIVERDFAAHVGAGRLEWREGNYDEPDQRHFDTKYKLGRVPTLVLVRVQGSDELEARKLGDGFMLIVTGEKDKFTGYVRRQLQAFLDKKPAPEEEF
jgi:hypothetical protein